MQNAYGGCDLRQIAPGFNYLAQLGRFLAGAISTLARTNLVRGRGPWSAIDLHRRRCVQLHARTMSGVAYNAAVDLVDRHVADGRGARIAYRDERGACSYERARPARRRCRPGVARARNRSRAARPHRPRRRRRLRGHVSRRHEARRRPGAAEHDAQAARLRAPGARQPRAARRRQRRPGAARRSGVGSTASSSPRRWPRSPRASLRRCRRFPRRPTTSPSGSTRPARRARPRRPSICTRT